MLCNHQRSGMLKVILMVVLGIFCSIALLMISYWRDAQYQPSGFDLWGYLVLLPFGLSMLIFAPYFWKKWQNKRQQETPLHTKNIEPNNEQSNQMDPDSQCLTFAIYATAIHSGLGENKQLLNAVINLTAPMLDHSLIDAHGHPILSYRITDIDQEITQIEPNVFTTHSALRIWKLIEHQLSQYTEALQHIAKQLQYSALFYDAQPTQQYQLHPAWLNATNIQNTDQKPIKGGVRPPRSTLHTLEIYLIFSERFASDLDEQEMNLKIGEYLKQFQITETQIHCQFHYLSKLNHYTDYLEILSAISQQTERIFLLIIADSEIDQEYLDKKFTAVSTYIPAEFSCSCLITSPEMQIENLKAIKTLHIINHQKHLIPSLHRLDLIESKQYQQDIPFVYVLEQILTAKKMQQLQHFFVGSSIEPEHYFYSKNSLGHSDRLIKIFEFYLALQAELTSHSIIYSLEHPLTQVFVLQENNID